jgi:hypothetical protein
LSRACSVHLGLPFYLNQVAATSEDYDSIHNLKLLADYLVSIGETPCLSHDQASKIIKLWNELSPFDKRSTAFAPRYKSKLSKGRFKSSKAKFLPGVDSTKTV